MLYLPGFPCPVFPYSFFDFPRSNSPTPQFRFPFLFFPFFLLSVFPRAFFPPPPTDRRVCSSILPLHLKPVPFPEAHFETIGSLPPLSGSSFTSSIHHTACKRSSGFPLTLYPQSFHPTFALELAPPLSSPRRQSLIFRLFSFRFFHFQILF